MDDRYDMYPMPVIDDYFTVSDGLHGLEPCARPPRRRRGGLGPPRRARVAARQVADWERVHTDKTHAVWVRVDTASIRASERLDALVEQQ